MAVVPTARAALSRYFVTLSPETDLVAAIDVLMKKGASGAPVVNEQGELVGVLTEKDCLRLLSHSAWGEASGGKVRHYMSTVKAVVSVEMDLFAAASVFLDNHFPILPLMEGEQLAGRISRHDLLRQILELARSLEKQRKREERKGS